MLNLILLSGLLVGLAVDVDDDPEPPRERGPVSVRMEVKKTTYKLDRGGLSEAAYRDHIKAGKAKPVPIELKFVVTNRTKSSIQVKTHGSEENCWLAGHTLTLEGPGATHGSPYWSDNKQHPSAISVVLKPGERTTIAVKTLTSHSASVQLYDHFWTKPGDYKLSAELMLPVAFDWNDQKEQGTAAKTLRLKTPVIRLKVEE